MHGNEKHLATITGIFVAVLLISNIASSKITEFFMFTFDAGTILFPISYIFGDVLTEVYGYKRSRKVIWTGFIAALGMSLYLALVSALPPAAGWTGQAAFETILGFVPRITIASLIAYLAGEFSNSYILAKMKVKTKGKHLWARTIASTIVGEGIDTALFAIVAFWGLLPTELLVAIIVSNYVFKVGVEVLFTPVTYRVVNFLKKEEGLDVYDTKTNFNPLKLD